MSLPVLYPGLSCWTKPMSKKIFLKIFLYLSPHSHITPGHISSRKDRKDIQCKDLSIHLSDLLICAAFVALYFSTSVTADPKWPLLCVVCPWLEVKATVSAAGSYPHSTNVITLRQTLDQLRKPQLQHFVKVLGTF